MGHRPDKFNVNDQEWQSAVAREAIIRPLAEAGRLSTVDVKTACTILGLGRSRLYALIEKYRNVPLTSSLISAAPGPKTGARRLASEMEALIEEAIQEKYLTRQKASVSKLHDHIRHLCRARGLQSPSWKAVRSRVAQIDRLRLISRREGSKVARSRLKPVVHDYQADHALHVVQIDHTLVDLFVVDAVHRQPIQRPWLTLAVDVASRMVVGFYVSLEAPSSASVALAMHQAVMPKGEWLKARDIELDWPVCGLPDIVHVDNGREFRARALSRGAAEYGIELMHRPVARPHYGGHIERLIGTMMGAVHMLPGTTFSTIAERGDYEPDRHATMTLDELERWLALEIVGHYHQAVHSSLHIPPIAAWQEAIDRRPAPFRYPHDAQKFFHDFLPFEERSIRRDGVHLFGFRYWDDVLSPWAGRLGRRLRVKYDPRDLSTVFVEGPDGAHWPLRYADLRRPRITLGEHRLALAALKRRGIRLVDEQVIFDTVEAQRQLVDAAASTTRSARRHGERRAQSARASNVDKPTAPVATGLEEYSATLPILGVEEWS